MTDRTAKIVHGVLLAILAAGIGVRLWRLYGFAPLTVRDTGRGRP